MSNRSIYPPMYPRPTGVNGRFIKPMWPLADPTAPPLYLWHLGKKYEVPVVDPDAPGFPANVTGLCVASKSRVPLDAPMETTKQYLTDDPFDDHVDFSLLRDMRPENVVLLLRPGGTRGRPERIDSFFCLLMRNHYEFAHRLSDLKEIPPAHEFRVYRKFNRLADVEGLIEPDSYDHLACHHSGQDDYVPYKHSEELLLALMNRMIENGEVREAALHPSECLSAKYDQTYAHLPEPALYAPLPSPEQAFWTLSTNECAARYMAGVARRGAPFCNLRDLSNIGSWEEHLRFARQPTPQDQSEAIACLRRAGWSVSRLKAGFARESLLAYEPGHSPTLWTQLILCQYHRRNGEDEDQMTVLWARTPSVSRCLAVVKCVPRLLAWLRQARIALFHPSRPEVRDEMETGMVEVMEEIAGMGPMA